MFLTLLIFVLASVGGATAPVFIKIAVKEMPPLTITAFRFLIPAIIISPFWLKNKEFISKKDIYKVIPFGMNMAFFSVGIQYTSVAMSQILYTIVPILVGFLGFFFLKEKLSKNNIIGLLISAIGVGILLNGSFQTQDIHSFGQPIGNLLVLVAVLSWATYLVTARSLSKQYSTLTILFYDFFVTSIVLFLILPFEWHIRSFSLHSVSMVGILSIAALGLINSLLVYFCYQWLIKNLTAFLASLTQYLNVGAGAIAGVIIFGEHLTNQLIVGTFFVIVGVFLATTYQQLKKRRNAVVQ